MTTFEQIRAAMAAKTNTATSAVAEATNTLTEKVKAAATTVGSVMPATNAKLNDRTEKLLAIIEQQGLELDALYAHFGLAKPEIQATDVSALVAARMESIKAKQEKQEEVAAPVQEAPVVPQNAMQARIAAFLGIPVAEPQAPVTINPQPSGEAPKTEKVEPAEPTQEQIAASYAAPQRMGGLQLSSPSNWHLA